MMGRTAAGKSTLAQYLARALGARYVSEAALKRALVRDYSTECSLDESLRDLGYSAASAVAKECINRHESVVVDAAYHRIDRRRNLLDATAHPGRRLVIAYCRCDDEHETRRRITARVAMIASPLTQANSYSVFEHIDRTFQELTIDEIAARDGVTVLRFDSWNNTFAIEDPFAVASNEQLSSIMNRYVVSMKMLPLAPGESVC